MNKKYTQRFFWILALVSFGSTAFATVTSNPSISTSPTTAVPALTPIMAVVLAVVVGYAMMKSRGGILRLLVVGLAVVGSWSVRDDLISAARAIGPTILPPVNISVATTTTTDIPITTFCASISGTPFNVEAGVYNSTSTPLSVTTVSIPAGITQQTPTSGPQCTTSTTLPANGSASAPECYIRVTGTC